MTTSRRFSVLAGLAIVLLAALLRVPSLTAARPYINYVDEGHYLHPVAQMLGRGSWDPHNYMYPQLPLTLAAVAARLYAPFHPLRHGGRTFHQDLVVTNPAYDVLEPFELLLTGRLLSFLAGLGLVILTGLYGRRLLGVPGGLFAAFLAAWLPSLVIRGSIATIDPFAALFALACFLFMDRVRTSERPGREAFLAGAMAGLAFASKYPAVLAVLGSGLTLLLDEHSWRDKRRWLMLCAAGTLAGMIAGMPALVLHPVDVAMALERQNQIYTHSRTAQLWEQAILRAEWDLPYEHPELGIPFLVLATAGTVVALRDKRLARTAAGWLLFIAITLVLFLSKIAQPFRNLLPLVPLLCLLVAVLHTRIRERLARPVWADAGAVLVVLALFGSPVVRWGLQQKEVVDSRRQAIDWLVAHSGPHDTVMLSRELVFAPSELARLPGKAVQRRWILSRAAIRNRIPRFLVLGRISYDGGEPVDTAAQAVVVRGYVERARFGVYATPEALNYWKGTAQLVSVLERKERKTPRTQRTPQGPGPPRP